MSDMDSEKVFRDAMEELCNGVERALAGAMTLYTLAVQAGIGDADKMKESLLGAVRAFVVLRCLQLICEASVAERRKEVDL